MCDVLLAYQLRSILNIISLSFLKNTPSVQIVSDKIFEEDKAKAEEEANTFSSSGIKQEATASAVDTVLGVKMETTAADEGQHNFILADVSLDFVLFVSIRSILEAKC